MIRNLKITDIDEIRRIHANNFAHEFEIPNFFDKFLSVSVITDDDSGKIVTIGGIRTIAECIAITDKSLSVRARKKALEILLQASIFTCARTGYGQIHAFVQDEHWTRHLGKVGFQPTRGRALVLTDF